MSGAGRWGGSERDREKERAARDQRNAALDREREADRDARHAASQGNNRPTVVQLDGLVLLKIINHSREAMPDVVSGQLLGLDIGQKLEVTNSFPFPLGLSEEASDAYQLEMMKHLRTVNVRCTLTARCTPDARCEQRCMEHAVAFMLLPRIALRCSLC
jgi:hypothetical protein